MKPSTTTPEPFQVVSDAASPAPPDGYRLELQHKFPARRELVFHAWTDREAVEQWFCRDGDKNKVRVVKFDVRPEGAFRVEVDAATESYIMFCTFQEIEAPRRITFTWGWERIRPDAGQLRSDGDTLVTVQFLEDGDSTNVKLTQGSFPTVERRDADLHSWTASFEALERTLRESRDREPQRAHAGQPPLKTIEERDREQGGGKGTWER